jgi:tRNA (adenine57-N1/adenine58-N1)-methyltransferase catalytic subunit
MKPTSSRVSYGDTVLLVSKDRKSYIRTLTPGGDLSTHLGKIKFDDMIDLPYGSAMFTHLNNLFYLLRPQIPDLIAHGRHETAIIQPQDLGYITLKLGIRPGVHVAEAGTGSGALTVTLALLVGESGHVYTFERKEALHDVVLKNLKRAGVVDRVTFTFCDIKEGFNVTDVDALFLDVPDPWNYLTQARAAMASGGYFGAIVPTMNQVIDLVNAMYIGPWFMLEVEEILLRSYKVTQARIRPDEQMVGHTGYLIFARAVNRDAAGEPPEQPAPPAVE